MTDLAKDLAKDPTQVSENFTQSLYTDEDGSRSLFTRVKDSFKRQELVETEGIDLDTYSMTDYQRTNYLLAKQPYQKNLSQRHLTMIAIGGRWEQVSSSVSVGH